MELIVISESKLKIMLTAPDMARYELESTRMDCADAHTRAAFRHIFDDARAEIGFATEGKRLFVQLYASKEGGCEIFVTALGRDEGERESSEEDGGLTEGECALLRQLYGEEGEEMTTESMDHWPAAVSARRTALLFEDVGALLTACHRLLREGYRGRSGLYIVESGEKTAWYLLLEIPQAPLYRLPLDLAFLTEYGREMSYHGLESYLGEHGRSICLENAVQVMGTL